MLAMSVGLLGSEVRNFYAGCDEGVQIITSKEGLPQGAPSSGVFFGLVKGDITEQSNKMLSTGYSLDYVDDNKSSGKTEELMDMYRYVKDAGTHVGIHQSAQKNEVMLGLKSSREEALKVQELWCINNDISTDQVLIHPGNAADSLTNERYGLISVGIPDGSVAFVEKFMLDKLQEVKAQFLKIPTFEDPQVEFHLLRVIMNSKTNHILRGVPPSLTKFLNEQISIMQRECVTSILRLKEISDQVWAVIRLHFEGRLGFIEDSPQSAYVASVLASLPFLRNKLDKLDEMVFEVEAIFDDFSLESLQLKMGEMGCTPALEEFFSEAKRIQLQDPSISIAELLQMPEELLEKKKLQHEIGAGKRDSRTKSYVQSVFQNGDSVAATRCDSISNDQSISWLLAPPTCAATRMSKAQWLTAAYLRFGIKFPDILPGMKCKCRGNPLLDREGNHLQKCKDLHALTFGTHEMLGSVVLSVVKYSGQPCSSSFPAPFVNVMTNSNGRPTEKKGDIMIYKGATGNVMLDIRVTNPITAAVERGVFVEKGAGANTSEREKLNKYKDLSDAVGIHFKPIVSDSYGYWGPEFIKFFNQTIAIAADNKKINISFVKNYWEQRIAMSIQKGVANAVNARLHKLRCGLEAQLDESADITVVQGQSLARGSAGMFGS